MNYATMKSVIARVRSGLMNTNAFALILAMEVSLRLLGLASRHWGEERRAAAAARVARLWGAATWKSGCFLLGCRLFLEGDRETQGRCIVVSNHQSSIDIPLLFYLFPRLDLKFVAIDSFRSGKPGISLALRTTGCAFVKKTSFGEDLAEMGRFGERMERLGGSPVIFPEGIRSKDGDLLPFNFAGVEAVRRTARLPILPVTIDGLWRSRTLPDLHALVGGTVRVRIGEAVPWEEFDRDPREAYDRIVQRIRTNLRQMRG